MRCVTIVSVESDEHLDRIIRAELARAAESSGCDLAVTATELPDQPVRWPRLVTLRRTPAAPTARRMTPLAAESR